MSAQVLGWIALAIGPSPEADTLEDEVIEELGDEDEGTVRDPQLVEAGALSSEAHAAFEIHNYDGAIELWGQALAVLDVSPEHAQSRNGILTLLAQAHAQAYEIDGDIEHLRIADRLLGDYLHNLPDKVDATVVEVEVDRIQKELARYEEAQRQERAKERQALLAAELEASNARADSVVVEREAGLKSARRFIVSGSVMAGTGVACLGVTAGMLGWGVALDDKGERERANGAPEADLAEIIDQGRLANGLAIGMGVTGGLLTTAGVSFVVVGARRRKAAMQLSAVPVGGRDRAGVMLVGRF